MISYYMVLTHFLLFHFLSTLVLTRIVLHPPRRKDCRLSPKFLQSEQGIVSYNFDYINWLYLNTKIVVLYRYYFSCVQKLTGMPKCRVKTINDLHV